MRLSRSDFLCLASLCNLDSMYAPHNLRRSCWSDWSTGWVSFIPPVLCCSATIRI